MQVNNVGLLHSCMSCLLWSIESIVGISLSGNQPCVALVNMLLTCMCAKWRFVHVLSVKRETCSVNEE